MAAAGVDPAGLGRDEAALARVGCFVELHVEQGRALDGRPSAWPPRSGRTAAGGCTFTGRADHAGTTRLADRSDPVLAFAATALAAREAAGRHGALATYGRVQVVPGGTNAVAASVTAWLDARAPDEATLTALVEDVRTATRRRRAHGHRRARSRSPGPPRSTSTTACATGSPRCWRTAAADRRRPRRGRARGPRADRDAVRPQPHRHRHSPAESADRADCLAGVEALTAVLEDLL